MKKFILIFLVGLSVSMLAQQVPADFTKALQEKNWLAADQIINKTLKEGRLHEAGKLRSQLIDAQYQAKTRGEQPISIQPVEPTPGQEPGVAEKINQLLASHTNYLAKRTPADIDFFQYYVNALDNRLKGQVNVEEMEYISQVVDIIDDAKIFPTLSDPDRFALFNQFLIQTQNRLNELQQMPQAPAILPVITPEQPAQTPTPQGIVQADLNTLVAAHKNFMDQSYDIVSLQNYQEALKDPKLEFPAEMLQQIDSTGIFPRLNAAQKRYIQNAFLAQVEDRLEAIKASHQKLDTEVSQEQLASLLARHKIDIGNIHDKNWLVNYIVELDIADPSTEPDLSPGTWFGGVDQEQIFLKATPDKRTSIYEVFKQHAQDRLTELQRAAQ